MLHRNLECEIHESRKIGSGQTGDGKNEHWHFRNQWTKMDEVFLPTPRKGNAKECSKYCTIALISHASKVMLKILQVSLQQYMNQEIPDVQAGFRKGRWIRDQIANIHWIIGKTRKLKKKIYIIDYAKVFDCVNHNKLENSSSDRNTGPPFLAPEKSICRSRINRTGHGAMDWFKTGEGVFKAVYCHPAYLTYMQSTICEMSCWLKDKLESRLTGKI